MAKLNWQRPGLVGGAVAALGMLVIVACGPGAATSTAIAPSPTPTRAAAPTATPTTAPAPTVATATPTRAPAATVVATPTSTKAGAPEGMSARDGVKRGGVLRYGWGTKPSIFDVHQSTTQVNTLDQLHRYDGLLRQNPKDNNMTIIPDLASSWEMSPDGLSYTFHLRPGVKFHDGSILTADDVVATYNKIIFPPSGVLAPRRELFLAVTKVEAVDPLTVRFVLKRPSAVTVAGAASAWNAIVSKKTLEQYSYNLRTVKDFPGTGPFRLVSWTPGESVVSERNPDYWNSGLPYLDGVKVLEANANTGGAGVMSGQLEYAEPAIDFEKLAKESKGAVLSTRVGTTNPRAIYMNAKRPPFSDQRVRRAVHLAVNRQAIIEAATAAGSLIPFGGPWMALGGIWDTPVEEIEKLPGYRRDKTADIAEARKLMAAAGYANGVKDLDVLVRDTSGLQIEITGPALLDQLSVLGIAGTIRGSDSSAWSQDTQRGGWDLSIGYVNGIVDDPSGTWAIWFTTGAGYNYGGYSNPNFDKLTEQLDLISDYNQRLALVKQGNAILDEDPPMIFYGWLEKVVIWRSYVKELYAERFGLYDGGYVKMDTAWLDK